MKPRRIFFYGGMGPRFSAGFYEGDNGSPGLPPCNEAMVRLTEGDTKHIFCPSILLTIRDVRVKIAFFKENTDRDGDLCGTFQWYATEQNYIG